MSDSKVLVSNLGSRMEHSHDSRYQGPGIWILIHKSSCKDAVTFLGIIKLLASHFDCAVCRSHMQKYILNDPPQKLKEQLDDEGRDIRYAKWGWIFHNVVNERLGKPIMDWNKFKRIYMGSTSEVCSLDCGTDLTERGTRVVGTEKGISSDRFVGSR